MNANAIENLDMRQLDALIDFYERYRRKPGTNQRISMRVSAADLALVPGMGAGARPNEFDYRGRCIVALDGSDLV